MRISPAEARERLEAENNLLFLCHRNADPDALASAIALAERFGGSIGVVEGCNIVAQTLASELGRTILIDPSPADYGLTVAVDTSTHAQLNNIPIPRLAVIDHHSTASLFENAIWHVFEDADSTAEIVHKIAGTPSRESGLALVAGILTDTGHFKHARPSSFHAVAEILEETETTFGEVLDLLASTPNDISRRIAILKAAGRSEIHRVGDLLIVTSHVGSFGGSAAAAMVGLGADVAIVGTEKDAEKFRISGRARKTAVDQGLDLGAIMEHIGETYRGSGGGHAAAAGVNARGSLDAAMNEILQKTRDILT